MSISMFLRQFQWQFIWKKPHFLFRAARHMALNMIFPSHCAARTMNVMINAECNLTCDHCFAESYRKPQEQKPKLSHAEFVAALKEIAHSGVFHFSLQGGEPFLHPHLEELIKACQPHMSYISMTTNGTVCTEKKLRQVNSWGVDKITVSIDSFKAEEHDHFRGRKGSYDKAMQTIATVRQIGMDVAIAVTVLNETLHTDSIQDLLDWATKEQIAVEINIPQPIGKWDGRTDLLLSDENFAYINNLHAQNNNMRRDLYKHMGRSGCPAVKESLHLNVDGEIQPCVYIQISLGNIRNHNFREIRANGLRLPEFAHYDPKCLSGEEPGFIQRYMSKGFGLPKPANGMEIFGLPQPSPRQTPLVPKESGEK